VIKLVGPATTAERSLAVFAVELDPLASLAASESITFTLDTQPGTATEGSDFAALVAANLQAADSTEIELSNIVTNPLTGAVTVTVTNKSTSSSIGPGSTLITFALATKIDLVNEITAEQYTATLIPGTNASLPGGAPSQTIAVQISPDETITVLNWGRSVGNQTLDTFSPILVPESLAQAGISLSTIPPNIRGGFNVEGIDLSFAYTVDDATKPVAEQVGTFTLDSRGLKISTGSVLFNTTNLADYLLAIGYPPGTLSGGTYSNALDLSTIRMGDGNDYFAVVGTGITQSLSAEVNK
jgi:hypothetical protein